MTIEIAPVHKTITVRATAERAFQVFTAGVDTWWPRTHHIGNAPLQEIIIEGRVGGRCYSRQENGIDCDWGEVLVWEPPRRFVMAWKINPQWQFERDLAKSSEVEVSFTAEADGQTRVDLVHRFFERLGEDGAIMRANVDQPGGWGGLLQLYSARAEAA